MVKYLSSPSDVENENEVPDEFWRRARHEKPAEDTDFEFDLSDSDLDISVVRPMGVTGASAHRRDHEEDTDDLVVEGDLRGPSYEEASSQQNSNLETLTSEIAKIRRRLGVISTIAVLIFAVYFLSSLVG